MKKMETVTRRTSRVLRKALVRLKMGEQLFVERNMIQ